MNPTNGAPEHGVRFALTLSETGEDFLVYRGEVRLPTEQVALEVRLTRAPEAPGGVAAEGSAGERRDLADAAAALVRTAARSALVRGETPPRKVHRWRSIAGTLHHRNTGSSSHG